MDIRLSNMSTRLRRRVCLMGSTILPFGMNMVRCRSRCESNLTLQSFCALMLVMLFCTLLFNQAMVSLFGDISDADPVSVQHSSNVCFNAITPQQLTSS